MKKKQLQRMAAGHNYDNIFSSLLQPLFRKQASRLPENCRCAPRVSGMCAGWHTILPNCPVCREYGRFQTLIFFRNGVFMVAF